jgi:hypothetical protein
MSLSFTIVAGPRQRSHSQVRVLRDSLPYFTVSDSRVTQPGGLWLAFSSPRTTRRAPMEVFDPASIRDLSSSTTLFCATYIASRRIHRKHVHFLAMDVCCCPEHASTGPLPSNGCPIVDRLCHGKVFVDSFPSNGYTCHNIFECNSLFHIVPY